MNPTSRARSALPPEVLHRVSEINRVASNTRLRQRPVQHAAGRSDERSPLTILDITGLLADHHHPSLARARTEHRLRRPRIQIAAAAGLRRPSERPNLEGSGHEALRADIPNHDHGLPIRHHGQNPFVPELPDVEGYRRELARHLPGHRILGIQILDGGVLRNRTPIQFTRQLTGRRFAEPDRAGKWLILPTDGPTVLIHSGMTGRPYFADPENELAPHDRLVITTDNGQLRYTDLRKLRGVWLAVSESEAADVVGLQGHDAFRISVADFIVALRRRRGQLKPALMDQAVIAGLGNMLSDEICWRAHLHPARSVHELTDHDLERLHAQMSAVLRTAVRRGQIPRTATWLNSRRDHPDPTPCPRCGTTICRTRIGGRTSLWCPHCQPATG
jgi:formamidopyrimidine-DNA glycosylase